MSESENGIEGWVILELMGHRRLGGRLSEVTIASGAFIRIDFPHPNEAGKFTASQFYSSAAVYAITPATEEVACAIARGAPEQVSRWDLRALTQQAGDSGLSYAIETIVSELDEIDDHDGDDPFRVMTRCAPADASGVR